MAGLLLPPRDVKPDRLFRLLIARPRPSLAIHYRFPLAPDVPLRVVALRGIEEGEAWDSASGLEPEEARHIQVTAWIVSRCLFAGDSRVFQSVTDLDNLFQDELDALTTHVNQAMRIVSPAYQRVDLSAWNAVLEAGALDERNVNETFMMGSCSGDTCARPDWYFGRPLCELTDGQLMAFRVARKIVEEARKRG